MQWHRLSIADGAIWNEADFSMGLRQVVDTFAVGKFVCHDRAIIDIISSRRG